MCETASRIQNGCGMNFIIERSAPTPSALDNIPAEVEKELRVYGCEIIQEIGILLKV